MPRTQCIFSALVLTTALARLASAQFVYVNVGAVDISEYQLEARTGDLVTSGSPVQDGNAFVMVVHPTGRYLYVTQGVGVNAYSIDAHTGALTLVPGSPFPTTNGDVSTGAAIDPTGNFLYVVNEDISNINESNITGYSINRTTGALAPVDGSPFPTGTRNIPLFAVVHPSGNFVYVTSAQNPVGILGYAINTTTGALTPLAGSPFPALASVVAIGIDPTGQFVYAGSDQTDPGILSSYSVDATTGALTPITQTIIPPAALSMAMDPKGRFLYTTDPYTNNVSAYTINSTTGLLTPVTGSPFRAGNFPISSIVDSTGQYVYVANELSNNISAYTIDGTTGALTALRGSPFSSLPFPITIVEVPRSRR